MNDIDFTKSDEGGLIAFLRNHKIEGKNVDAQIPLAADRIAVEHGAEKWGRVIARLLDGTLEKSDHEILKRFDLVLTDIVKFFSHPGTPDLHDTAKEYDQARQAINALCRLKGIIMQTPKETKH